MDSGDSGTPLGILRQRRLDFCALARGYDSSSEGVTPAYCALALSDDYPESR